MLHIMNISEMGKAIHSAISSMTVHEEGPRVILQVV